MRLTDIAARIDFTDGTAVTALIVRGHDKPLSRRRFSEVVVAAGMFSGAVDELDDCTWGRGFPYIQRNVIGVLRLQTELLQHDHLR